MPIWWAATGRLTPRSDPLAVNTGARSERNLRTYRKAGYRGQPGEGTFPGTVDLLKRRR